MVGKPRTKNSPKSYRSRFSSTYRPLYCDSTILSTMNTQSEIAVDPKLSYKFACHWLHELALVKEQTGQEIMNQSLEFMNWLCENKVTHKWSTPVSKIPVDYSMLARGSLTNLNHYTFSNILFFEHQADLLAFRLRWGF